MPRIILLSFKIQQKVIVFESEAQNESPIAHSPRWIWKLSNNDINLMLYPKTNKQPKRAGNLLTVISAEA